MTRVLTRRVGWWGLALVILGAASLRSQALRELTASGQGQPDDTSAIVCGQQLPRPAALPAAVSGPVVYVIGLCFDPQGYQSRFPPEHYLSDIHLKPSALLRGLWTPYDAAAEKVILEDYQRLWNNNDLANLSIEVRDFQFSNGVIGKLVAYHITERN